MVNNAGSNYSKRQYSNEKKSSKMQQQDKGNKGGRQFKNQAKASPD